MAQLANAPEIDLETVKGRTVKGVVALTGRNFFLQIISFFGFFLLSVFLNQSEIGLFFAISELVAILGYFSDIGLAAALIQKREKPTIKEIRSTFTLQQALVLTLVILVFILTPWLKKFYRIEHEGVFLLWALTIGFFLASLKTIPSVLLERKLHFDLLVMVEIAESVLFYGLAVLLAWNGFGVVSYAWAVLARGVIGVILIYILSPWPIGLTVERDSLLGLLKFGVPYQANNLLAVIKDRLMNVFLWKIVGTSGVGILGWAQKWSQMPLRFVMDSIMKVTFPAYARMQEDKNELKRAVEKTLYLVSLFTFPLLVGMLVLAKPLIAIIPRYSKWNVALFPLYLFIVNSAFGAITTPLTNALTAIGKIKTVFKLMIMWTVLTWLLYPILGLKYGFNGVAAGAAIVSLSSIIAIGIAKKHIGFKFPQPIIKPLGASILMGFFIFIFSLYLSKNVFNVIALVIIGGLLYLSLIYLMAGRTLIEDLKKVFYAFKKS